MNYYILIHPLQYTRLRVISEEIKACKARILVIMSKNKIIENDDILRVEYFLHTLRIFEAELLARLKEWDQLLQVVGVIAILVTCPYSALI